MYIDYKIRKLRNKNRKFTIELVLYEGDFVPVKQTNMVGLIDIPELVYVRRSIVGRKTITKFNGTEKTIANLIKKEFNASQQAGYPNYTLLKEQTYA